MVEQAVGLSFTQEVRQAGYQKVARPITSPVISLETLSTGKDMIGKYLFVATFEKVVSSICRDWAFNHDGDLWLVPQIPKK